MSQKSFTDMSKNLALGCVTLVCALSLSLTGCKKAKEVYGNVKAKLLGDKPPVTQSAKAAPDAAASPAQ